MSTLSSFSAQGANQAWGGFAQLCKLNPSLLVRCENQNPRADPQTANTVHIRHWPSSLSPRPVISCCTCVSFLYRLPNYAGWGNEMPVEILGWKEWYAWEIVTQKRFHFFQWITSFQWGKRGLLPAGTLQQWWSVTKYNYFVTVLKYIFQVSVLYWSSFILSNFYFYFTTVQSIRSYFLLHYIS